MERAAQTYQDIRPVLDQFKQTYMERPPVIGAGLGAAHIRRRFVFQAYLDQEPTPDQQIKLKKTFRRVPIRYEVTGPIGAAGAGGAASLEERFPELAAV